jgi:dodecin
LFTVAQARRSAVLADAAVLVAFLDMLGLALLLVRVGGFVATRHYRSPVAASRPADRNGARTRHGPQAFNPCGAAVAPQLLRHNGRRAMQDHVYKIVELVGSSETSIEDAVQSAIARASRTLRHLRWFEIAQMRGHVEEGKVQHYQVTLKAGFTLEDPPG